MSARVRSTIYHSRDAAAKEYTPQDTPFDRLASYVLVLFPTILSLPFMLLKHNTGVRNEIGNIKICLTCAYGLPIFLLQITMRRKAIL